MTEQEAIAQGFKSIRVNPSRYKFLGTKVYRKDDTEIAFYSDKVLEMYPQLKEIHGN